MDSDRQSTMERLSGEMEGINHVFENEEDYQRSFLALPHEEVKDPNHFAKGSIDSQNTLSSNHPINIIKNAMAFHKNSAILDEKLDPMQVQNKSRRNSNRPVSINYLKGTFREIRESQLNSSSFMQNIKKEVHQKYKGSNPNQLTEEESDDSNDKSISISSSTETESEEDEGENSDFKEISYFVDCLSKEEVSLVKTKTKEKLKCFFSLNERSRIMWELFVMLIACIN